MYVNIFQLIKPEPSGHIKSSRNCYNIVISP